MTCPGRTDETHDWFRQAARTEEQCASANAHGHRLADPAATHLQADVTAVGEITGGDVVLEVHSPGGTGKSARTAATADRVLTPSSDFGARCRVELRLEMVGGGESAVDTAVESTAEDLRPAFLVDPRTRVVFDA